jgi:hypothetical protein
MVAADSMVVVVVEAVAAEARTTAFGRPAPDSPGRALLSPVETSVSGKLATKIFT